MIAFYILAAVLIWILSGVLGGNNDIELVESDKKSVETNNTVSVRVMELSLIHI